MRRGSPGIHRIKLAAGLAERVGGATVSIKVGNGSKKAFV
jgi:hypothetical protein